MDLKKSIDFFVKNVLDSSSEEESCASSGLMVAAASLIHELTDMHMPMHRGSKRPRRDNLERDREGGHCRPYRDYFHPTEPVFAEALFRWRYRMSRDSFLTMTPTSDVGLMPLVS
jgi:hypothetical protein